MRNIVLGLCVSALACTSEAPQVPTAPSIPNARGDARSSSQDLPFSGSIQGSETDRVVPPTTLVVTSTGEGTATHLGRFAFTLDGVADLATGAGSGTFSLTAADQSSLVGTFTGQASPTTEPGVVTIDETAIITGGTRRLANATGLFTIRRTLNQQTGVTTGTFTGSVAERP